MDFVYSPAEIDAPLQGRVRAPWFSPSDAVVQ